MSADSYNALLDRLVDDEVVDEDDRTALADTLRQRLTDGDGDSSTILSLLAGAGAWVTMLFTITSLVALLSVTGMVQDEMVGGVVLAVIGALAGAFAVSIHRHEDRSGVFVDQSALSLSLASQVLIGSGVALLFGAATIAALATLLASWLLYTPISSYANRGLSALIALSAVAFAAGSFADGEVGLCLLYVALVALVTAVYAPGVLSARQRTLLKPAAAVGALFVAVGSTSLASELFDLPVTVIQTAALVLACGVFAAFIFLEGDRDEAATVRLGVVAAALVILGMITEPGVLCAIWLLAIAVWRREATLLVIGVVALAVHLTVYYYQLDTTLLAKSGSLIGAGLVLLALRWWLEWSAEDPAEGGEA